VTGCFRVHQGASGCIRVLRGASGSIEVRVARAVATAIAIVAGSSSSAFACPMCFGAEETSMIDGTKLGIFVLLAITLTVQGAFAGFFFYLRRRAKRIADADVDAEWSELQGVPKTS
jgi:heme/copper-type cytochrome/quinol oxidase subunit 2